MLLESKVLLSSNISHTNTGPARANWSESFLERDRYGNKWLCNLLFSQPKDAKKAKKNKTWTVDQVEILLNYLKDYKTKCDFNSITHITLTSYNFMDLLYQSTALLFPVVLL